MWLKRWAADPKKADYDYSSVHVKLPSSLAGTMKDWAKNNIDENNLYIDEEENITGYEDYPHVTIKYGIHDKEPNKVKELLESESPVHLLLDKITIFKPEGKPYDVVVVTIKSDDLHKLNKKVSDNMEVTDTFPEYKPHATLAYVQKGMGDEFEGMQPFKDEVTIDRAEFSGKNKGGKHEIKFNGKRTESGSEKNKLDSKTN